jgi:hypothetical protein
MNNIKYLIVSWENQGVFTVETDPVIANSLASSNINCFPRAIFEFNFPKIDNITNRDYFKNNYYKLESKGFELQPLASNLISSDWLAEQEAMFFRQDAHLFLKYHSSTAMMGMERNMWENFSIEAEIELDKCDPDSGVYTRPIEEYARTLKKSVEQTYKELKLTVEGEKLVRFRIAALTKFFQLKINDIKTVAERDFIKKYIVNEFWNKSQI